jgi:hypothetical protein
MPDRLLEDPFDVPAEFPHEIAVRSALNGKLQWARDNDRIGTLLVRSRDPELRRVGAVSDDQRTHGSTPLETGHCWFARRISLCAMPRPVKGGTGRHRVDPYTAGSVCESRKRVCYPWDRATSSLLGATWQIEPIGSQATSRLVWSLEAMSAQ